jgi:hypothetical protein
VLAAAAGTLDFGKPVAVTVHMTLHAIPDEADPPPDQAFYAKR